MKLIRTRNVNTAIDVLRGMFNDVNRWDSRITRGQETLEWDEPVITEYLYPEERVSFSVARDANPFFHLFEAIWILAGRSDVAFLKLFNSKIDQYSDDGIVFHAPYGHRLRRHFWRPSIGNPSEPVYVDQIKEVISLFETDPDTRRGVMCIWNPSEDLNVESKDIPCNDTLFFKKRGDYLDLTVCCRSNDAIWGAYGANAVQFSFLLEFMAGALGLDVGKYRQVSDSFHVYPAVDVYQKMLRNFDWRADLYEQEIVTRIPLFDTSTEWPEFLLQCESFCDDVMKASFIEHESYGFFFQDVAIPMWAAWHEYKINGVRRGIDVLEKLNSRVDWVEAGIRWLVRRAR